MLEFQRLFLILKRQFYQIWTQWHLNFVYISDDFIVMREWGVWFVWPRVSQLKQEQVVLFFNNLLSKKLFKNTI